MPNKNKDEKETNKCEKDSTADPTNKNVGETSNAQQNSLLNLLKMFVEEESASLTRLSDTGFFDRKVVGLLMNKIMEMLASYFATKNLLVEYKLCDVNRKRFLGAFSIMYTQTLDKSRHFCMHLQEIVSYKFFQVF